MMNWLMKIIIKYDIDPATVYLVGMLIAAAVLGVGMVIAGLNGYL